jgi:hypothetical protein
MEFTFNCLFRLIFRLITPTDGVFVAVGDLPGYPAKPKRLADQAAFSIAQAPSEGT